MRLFPSPKNRIMRGPGVPYDSLNLVHFQVGIQAPKRHFFGQQFCVGLLQTVCKTKQWAKEPSEILKLLTPAPRSGLEKRFILILVQFLEIFF